MRRHRLRLQLKYIHLLLRYDDLEQIVLRHRVYGFHKNSLLKIMRHVITSRTSELDVWLSDFETDPRGHVVLKIDGEDATFVKNFLDREYGLALDIHDLRVQHEYTGHLVDVGKVGYGLYVDIGVVYPSFIDAMVPLYVLRDETGLQGRSVKSIARLFSLVDNLPANVVIRKIDTDKHEIEGELSKSVFERVAQWARDDHERLLVFGVTRNMINDALERSGHSSDIIQIDRLGPYEFAIVCKRSTHAAGIVAAIGTHLRGIPIHLFLPKEFEVMKSNDQA